MRRREIIALFGIGIACPVLAQSEQTSLPVIGFLGLNSNARDGARHIIAGFRRGLAEAGFSENKNVAVDYQFAEERIERLPELAADLVRRRVAVICTTSNVAALAVKQLDTDIAHVFVVGLDPVQLGLVEAIDRPGASRTGIFFPVSALEPKRLELLRELLPQVRLVAALVNPGNPNAETHVVDLEAAARAFGLDLLVLRARGGLDYEAAFEAIAQRGAGALVVTSDPLFDNRRQTLVELAARKSIPTIYPWRDFADAGGLLSYGNSLTDAARQMGVYAGRILKGQKPSELPVWIPSKFELVINLRTAIGLNLMIPATLLARADEVIE